jgi:putative ATP-binding cassette transporter
MHLSSNTPPPPLAAAAAKKIGFRAVWRLVSPYWRSSERWSAFAIAALVIALSYASVQISVEISYWEKDFFDALAGYQQSHFWGLMIKLALIYFIHVITNVSETWFQQLLEIRWRAWLTKNFLSRWLKENAFHRIEATAATDNPDQRIAEDLRDMVRDVIRLSLGFFSTVCSLIRFSAIIWATAGALDFTFAGYDFHIPGYMFWVALGYALATTFFMEKIGRRLVVAGYEQQRREADFRFSLVRVRDHSGQIAMLDGGAAEERTLVRRFAAVRDNWRQIMACTKRVGIFTQLHINFGAYLPYIIIAPRYFAKLITLGDVQQLYLSFQRMRIGFSWFVYTYTSIATLRAVLRRLAEFDTLLAPEKPHEATPAAAASPLAAIALTRSGAAALRVRDLALALPDGKLLARVGSLTVQPGERWLVRGVSGAGKSTFLRTLAGLWPHGSGAIDLPDGRMLFLPQEPYLPQGTLKTALCYPVAPESVPDGECERVLRLCALDGRIGELSADLPWEKTLSPGEKQRLAFARALLHRPAFLFLDEATSALDPATEHRVLTALFAELPAAAVISVAHHASLAAFHNNVLEITAAGTGN